MRFRARFVLVVLAALAAAAAARPAEREGAADAAVVAALGGAYRDPALTAYVRSVGLRLVAAAGRSRAAWHFAVLDTPEANAFTLPNGRIYVTRGMLALANDEAELAAILGHEIGHAVAGDGTVRRGSRARRASEFAADSLGMRLMVAAGYDPAGEPDLLEALLASDALSLRRRGRSPAPAHAGHGDHPAIADRLAVARADAGAVGAGTGRRNRTAYLRAIDGLVWGDGPAQGFVRGRSFLHPDLRFAFDAPAGYALINRPDAVVAAGPGGAMLLLDSLPDPGGTPEGYLVGGWVPEIARGVRTGPLEAVRRTSLHGMSAAEGVLPLATGDSARVAQLTVVRHGGRLYRLTGLFSPGDTAGARALDAAASSFRALSAREAARAEPLRIGIHRIARGDDVAAMAAAMPVGAPRAQFNVLNGLRPGDGLRVGDWIKLVAD